MSVKISAFGSSIIEFNVENSMDYIMRENNGIKAYDSDGNIIKEDYDKYFSYYEYM